MNRMKEVILSIEMRQKHWAVGDGELTHSYLLADRPLGHEVQLFGLAKLAGDDRGS